MENSLLDLKTDRYWQIVKRRWLAALTTFVTVSTLGIITTASKTDIYEAEAKLKFQQINTVSSIAEISEELKALSTIAESDSIDTEAEVIRSTPIVRETIDELDLKGSEDKPLKVKDFRSKLNITEITSTNILKITYQHPNPQLAQKAVNTLVNNYLENNIITNRVEVEEAKKSLEKQIVDARKELEETENALAELKSNKQILSSEKEVSKIVNSLENIDNKLIEAKSQLSNISSQSQYIKEQLNMDARQALNTVTVSQSPIVQQTVARLEELELQLDREQNRFSNNHPLIVELQEKISRQEQLLVEQIKNITGSSFLLSENTPQLATNKQLAIELIKLESSSIGLTEQIAYLTEIEKNLKQKAIAFPEIEQQLDRLERQLKVAQKTYELLTDRLSLLEVSAERNLSNVRVVSYATIPDTPVSARSLDYIVAIIFGLLCAVIVVYLLEIGDRSLKTVKEAKQLFGYNWLGIIPSFEQKGSVNRLEAGKDKNDLAVGDRKIASLVVKDKPGSSVSESYRMLQSNLRFLQSDRQTQTIVITSSVSKEGKSTVAANLAGAMAQVGHKVLLVDADLHTPTQHLIWDTYSDCGLSELLTKDLDSRLITEQVMKNLSIVASGKIPLSPATLLDSHKMKDLMYYWANNYDFVIIDSPSLDKAADAPILGRMADGVLLVVKPDSIDRSQANFAKETLQRSGINVLGLVFNDIDPKVDASGHYYHSLEGKSNIPSKQLASEPEELWDSICRIAQEAPKLRLSSVTDAQQLLEAPIDRLEETIDRLQHDLEKLTAFVKDQEDELILKRQVVRKLQRKVNLAPIPERFTLEGKLTQERENKQMLDRTLVGQRRNLERKKEILRQYKEMLAVESD